MIEILEMNEENIVGIAVDGKVEKSDMKEVLTTFGDKIAGNGKIKFYAEINNFGVKDVSADAIIEEVLFWLKHPMMITDIEKAAVVTDSKWIEKAFDIECALIPTLEGKSFVPGEKEEALQWLNSDQREQSRMDLTFAELVETSTLKFAGGFALGLMTAGFFGGKRRRNIGGAIMFGTIAAGIPLGIKILNNNRQLLKRAS